MHMNPRLALAAAAVAALATAAPASASTGSLKLTSKARKASSGYSAKLTIGASKQGEPVTKIALRFAKGTVLDPKGAVLCTASQPDRQQQGHAAVCPKGSNVGGGTATALFNGQKLTADLSAWNVLTAEAGPVLNLEENLNGTRLGYFTGRYKSPVLTFEFGALSVIGVKINIKPKHRKVGGKRHDFVRTPAKCPKGGWRNSIVVTYKDGSKDTVRSRSACRR